MAHHLVEYPELIGRKVRRFLFSNNPEWKCITVEFTDDTVLSFKMELELNPEVELSVKCEGDLQDFRILDGVQVKPKGVPQTSDSKL
jgi:hypothetical protein